MNLITPDWPSPENVCAFTTTRLGGCSEGRWQSMNLSFNCGDDASAVALNHEKLARGLPAQPQWLRQVHGTQVVTHPGRITAEPEADAILSRTAGAVCAVLTADCLPVLFCNLSGSCVAIAHAGWKGLAQGVLKKTVNAMQQQPEQIMAWLGPAIGPTAYEVGEDVKTVFGDAAASFFIARKDRWLLNLYGVARHQLAQLGIVRIYGGEYCTFNDSERFFSYRRDGITGRMASLIWLHR